MALDQPIYLSICHSNTLDSGNWNQDLLKLKIQFRLPSERGVEGSVFCFEPRPVTMYHPILYFYLGLTPNTPTPSANTQPQIQNTPVQIQIPKQTMTRECLVLSRDQLPPPRSTWVCHTQLPGPPSHPTSPGILPSLEFLSYLSLIFLNFTKAPHSDNQDF